MFSKAPDNFVPHFAASLFLATICSAKGQCVRAEIHQLTQAFVSLLG